MRYQLKNSSYALSKEEIRKLINALPKFRDRLILKLLAGAGMRRAEVAELPIMAIDFKRCLISVVGKGEKLRMVPVSPEVINDLREWIGKRKRGFVFPAIRIRNAHISERAINYICKKAGDLAEVLHPNPEKDLINPHLFRHSFANLWKDAGKRMDALQAVLGHSSFALTIDTYGTPSLAQIQAEASGVQFI